jgi:urease alpha subunit
MLMVRHHLDKDIAEDVAFAESRTAAIAVDTARTIWARSA